MAGWREALESRGVAPEVGRPVVAQHVQDQHLHALCVLQARVQAAQQAFVQAVVTLAQAWCRGGADNFGGQAIADPLAAGLVVAPLHRSPGARQHVQQRLAATDASLVVVAPADGREHARQRHLGAGAAGADVGEVEYWQLSQARRGLAGVAVEAPVSRAHRFADHDDHQARLG